MKRVSIVVPAHNESENLITLVTQLSDQQSRLNGWDMHIIIVDDGSQDDTVQIIKTLHKTYSVELIRLSQNFGHQNALLAGLKRADGDAVIMMDADLQHPPEKIPEMILAYENGAHIVQMVRDRQVCGLNGILSTLFYKLFKKVTGIELIEQGADFRLLSRYVVNLIHQIPEREIFFRALLPTLGFKIHCIQYLQPNRLKGISSYTLRKSFQLANKALFNYSTFPLKFISYLGLSLAMLSFIVGISFVVIKLIHGDSIVPGFTDIIVSIYFLSGCILGAIGILGHYLMLILNQVRGRPKYVVAPQNYD